MKPVLQALILLGALVALMLLSLTIGRYPVPLSDIVRVLLTSNLGTTIPHADTYRIVVEIIRLPRILEVTLCGMGLAMAGAAMQGVFRNPLVGPEVCGVSPAAAFGGIVGILLDWPSWGVVGSAFVFGIVALACAFGLAGLSSRRGTLALVLAGVIVGAFFGAMVGLAQYLADPQNKLPAIVYWLLGSFAGATYEKVGFDAAVMIIAGTGLLGLRWRINLMSLGETDARSLGVNVSVLRWSVVAFVAMIVAAQVSASGGVGFVGLIVPHFARMLVGPDHAKLLPASAVLGGLYLLAMDDIARSVAQQEVPIGLLTSVVGAPIFAFLFWRRQGRGWARE